MGIKLKAISLRRSFVCNNAFDTQIGHRDIHVLSVSGRAPLNTAERASFA